MSIPDSDRSANSEHPTGFNPKTASGAQWAAEYRRLDFQVIPARGKIPAIEWKKHQNQIMSDEEFDALYGVLDGTFADIANMGTILGPCSDHRFMLDLDTYKSAAAQTWWQGVLAVHNNGQELETWEQFTGGGGRQLFFECPEGYAPQNATTDLDIDVRGPGGFAVLPPSLHASGRQYAWRPGHEPWEMPILVAPAWLCDEIDRLIKEHGGGKGPGPKPHTNGNGQNPEYTGFARLTNGRERYMRDLQFAAMTGYCNQDIVPGEPEMMVEWVTYERHCGPKTIIAGEDNAAGLEREKRGFSLFKEKWDYTLSRWQEEVVPAAAERKAKEPPKASEPPREQPQTAPKLIPVRSAFPIDEQKIPPRDWVIPGFLLKRSMSMLVAPPGIGKSLFTLQVGIGVGVCMEWGGLVPRKPEKVLIINAEDDIDEMRRRLAAARREMNIDQSALVDRLYLAEAPESIVIAKMDARTRSIVRTPLVEDMVNTINHHGYGFVAVDPFAETFEADESSNSEVKWAGVLWREVARRTGCALLLVHHTKKYAKGMAGDADASRGGGSMIGVARSLCTMFDMTEEEATVMGVSPELRFDYVRFDDGKGNYSKRGMVRWFQKKTVTLDNSTGFLPGDDVGVLAPWKPAGPTEGISMPMLTMVWERIDRGLEDTKGMATGAYYSPSPASKDRWVGNVLMDELNCDESRAKLILKEWEKQKIVEVIEYLDPLQRKPRKGVHCVAANRPDKPMGLNL